MVTRCGGSTQQRERQPRRQTRRRVMATGTARKGEVELAYETFGSPGGEPLLLIMGLGLQMLWWPDGLCRALAERGFDVTRFDNRDFGLSTHFSAAGTPKM